MQAFGFALMVILIKACRRFMPPWPAILLQFALPIATAVIGITSVLNRWLERVQRKWVLVLRPHTRPFKKLEEDDDSKKIHLALEDPWLGIADPHRPGGLVLQL
jgi:hypothetical protein